MPSKEITALRKAGRLEEALTMATAELASDPDNIWPKRSISWVYFDYLIQSIESGHLETFEVYLHKILELHLSPEDKMLYDQLSWKIGMMVFELAKSNQPDVQACSRLLKAAQEFHYTKPSAGYSFLFKAFHKVLKETERYVQLCDWWDFQNFMPEDFEQEHLKNGKNMMAFAEQAYIAYAKHLLPKQAFNGETLFDREKALAFIPQLTSIVENYPQYSYPAYFKARLLLATGDKENLLASLLPFVRKMQHQFWAWDVLSEALAGEPDKVHACYCKALSCQSPENMLVKLRQKMARVLISKQLYDEARTEIDLLVKSKKETGFAVPFEVTQWQASDWYSKASVRPTNAAFYKKYIPVAESLLFADIPAESVIVEFVNTDKHMLNFIASEDKTGFFKYNRFLNAVAIGETLRVRFQGGVNEGLFQVYTAEKFNDENLKNQFLKEVRGVIKIGEGKAFGFIDGVYIHPSIISKLSLQDGMQVNGQCIKSYDRTKEQWGWKMIAMGLKI